MPTITLTPLATFPSGCTHTLGTSWQEFALDPRSRCVTVENHDETNDIYVAFDKMGVPGSWETPADGGTVGTHYSVVPANSSRVYRLREEGSDRDTSGSIFLAGAAGTPTCHLEQAKGPA